MFISSWPFLGLVSLLLGYFVYDTYFNRNDRKRLPPGPKPLPVVGNIRDLPPSDALEYQHWLKHKDLYGPISSVTVMGLTLVPIHNRQVAHELLNKAAGKTSGRPEMIFANKLCGYDSIILFKGYNDTFRLYRKLLHQELGTAALSSQFREVQELEAKRQLVRALNEPEKLLEHYKTTAAATILKMAYGYVIDPNKPDELVALIDRVLSQFSQAAIPMHWAVDILPALQYLPDGTPGASFKATARKYKNGMETCATTPFQFVKRQMASQNHKISYVSKLINHYATDGDIDNLDPEKEHAIIWTAMSLYGAASDTTIITLKVFTAAMILFPHVQQKAQEEIDRIVGDNRLPTFDDREDLPYIDALVKETLRWWPIAPLGFPHVVDEDLQYNGYDIPKGAYLLPAVHWFMHDPEVYHDPESFDPDRFLAPRNEPSPSTEPFGFGRRICPGRFFANASLYLNMAQALATFNFKNAVDENGEVIKVELVPQPGVLNYPKEFKHQITPRSQRHVELIRRIEEENPWEEGDASLLLS